MIRCKNCQNDQMPILTTKCLIYVKAGIFLLNWRNNLHFSSRQILQNCLVSLSFPIFCESGSTIVLLSSDITRLAFNQQKIMVPQELFCTPQPPSSSQAWKHKGASSSIGGYKGASSSIGGYDTRDHDLGCSAVCRLEPCAGLDFYLTPGPQANNLVTHMTLQC